jgi:2-haloacid dehalogenase
MGRVEVVVFDVNETLSDLGPLRRRFPDVGAEASLMDTWFAATLRDGFALAVTDRAAPFSRVAASVLRSLLPSPTDDAVAHVLDGFPLLDVHPDVPDGIRALAAAGVRMVTLTNGSAQLSAELLERAGVADLIERRLSVDEAGRWKPDLRAYAYAAEQCGTSLDRMALVAVHPWDIAGAQTAGMSGAWLDRAGRPYPEVFGRPDATGRDLPELAALVVGL